MSEEVKPTEAAPQAQEPNVYMQELISLIASGVNSVVTLFQQKLDEAAKSGSKELELSQEEFVDCFLYGVSLTAKQINRGLISVSLQELQFLAMLRNHKKTLKPGEKLVLGKAKAETNETGLVGADGKPLNQNSGGLILPGK